MILVDTSVWISFFRGEKKSVILKDYIIDNRISIHPYIKGELFLGGLSDAGFRLLDSIELLEPVKMEYVYKFISIHKLSGSGIGWVDVNLLASAKVSENSLLTYDVNLAYQADRLACLYKN